MQLLILVSIVILLSIVPPVSAGGGPVSLEAFPLKPFSQTQKFIVVANIYTQSPCDKIMVNFSFASPSESGDEITPFTPPNDGTYLKRHYYTGQSWQEICTKYVQVKSGDKHQSIIVAKTVVDGESISRDYPLNFGEDEYSRQTQSLDRYNNQPQVDVTSEKYLGGPKREVGLQWNKVEGAEKYSVFIRFGEVTTPYDLAPVATTSDNQATINLNAFEEFYISVNACKAGDPCTKSQQSPWEILLSKMRVSESELIPTPPSELNPNDATRLVGSNNEDRINQLNQKVADLEKKLQVSEKKQNILEQRFNELLTFLRSFLPFLR